jgi:hypothetical protein
MARWATTNNEIEHIVNISNSIPPGGLAEITLSNNQVIEGVITKRTQGNNAGREGYWSYYGEIEFTTKDGDNLIIDFLDMSNIINIWSQQKAKEYEELGLIQIVDFPNNN